MRSPTLRFSLHLSRMWSLGKLVVALGSDVSFVSTSSATVYASKVACDRDKEKGNNTHRKVTNTFGSWAIGGVKWARSPSSVTFVSDMT